MSDAGIDGLFSVDIDGDVGTDPNFMTLWFSQPSLGLPAKVTHDLITWSPQAEFHFVCV